MKAKILFLIAVLLSNPAFSDIQQGKVAFIDTKQSKIVELDINGNVTWTFDFPYQMRTRNLFQGPDIEWIPSTDSFLVLVPKKGIFEISRSKKIVWKYLTNKITHDADLLSNGNVIFVNGLDTERDPTFTEITRSGKIIKTWFASDHLHKSNPLFNQPSADLGGVSFSHANAVQRLENGNTLVSLRNFNSFVIVNPQGDIIKQSKKHTWIHDPVKLEKNICFAARKPNRVVCKNKFKTILKSTEWAPARTVEPLRNGNILITGSKKIGQLDSNGNIVWEISLPNFYFQPEAIKMQESFLYKATWVY
jgi:hypothetical protein